MAHVEKVGKSYRVIIQVGGKRHSFTLRDCTKTEAKRVAAAEEKRLRKLDVRVQDGLRGETRLSELLESYEAEHLPKLRESTLPGYRNAIKGLRTFFANDPAVDRIRPGNVKQYLSWIALHHADGSDRNKPLSKRSVQKARAIFQGIMEHGRDIEVIDVNPVPKEKPIDKPSRRTPYILTPEQYEKLLSESENDPTLYLYTLILGETGARCESEVLKLKWEYIDFDDVGYIFIKSAYQGYRTKQDRSHWVPMTPRLRAALAEHALRYKGAIYDGRESPWVFHHERRNRGAMPGSQIVSKESAFKSAAKRAKIPWGREGGFVTHDLRHRRPTTWIAEGKSPALVQEALGHAHIETTLWYTHLVKENLRSLVEAAGPAESSAGTELVQRQCVLS